MYCIYKMNNIHKQNGNKLYMKSLVPNVLFYVKCDICGVILSCFLLFFPNRDKRHWSKINARLYFECKGNVILEFLMSSNVMLFMFLFMIKFNFIVVIKALTR